MWLPLQIDEHRSSRIAQEIRLWHPYVPMVSNATIFTLVFETVFMPFFLTSIYSNTRVLLITRLASGSKNNCPRVSCSRDTNFYVLVYVVRIGAVIRFSKLSLSSQSASVRKTRAPCNAISFLMLTTSIVKPPYWFTDGQFSCICLTFYCLSRRTSVITYILFSIEIFS